MTHSSNINPNNQLKVAGTATFKLKTNNTFASEAANISTSL